VVKTAPLLRLKLTIDDPCPINARNDAPATPKGSKGNASGSLKRGLSAGLGDPSRR
jgi:hypothetical protein